MGLCTEALIKHLEYDDIVNPLMPAYF